MTFSLRRSIVVTALALLALPIQAAERSVAITIDDLPYQRGKTLAEIQTLTHDLVEQIRKHGAPVVAFVNETKLHERGEAELTARTALLEQWLDAGVELGNHTYSHMELNTNALEDYQQDILRGEEITKRLMRERGRTLRYFRHPYLHTGKEAETKANLERFLVQHGYTVAPVTIDNDEWIYAAAYDKAAEAKDAALMRRIGQDYLTYMDRAFEFSEDAAMQVFGRDIRQTLLIHANALNAEYYDELIEMMTRRGYRFISLPEALEDNAYRSKDTYVGPKGLSWLFRWAEGNELDTSKAPPIPAYVRELSGT